MVSQALSVDDGRPRKTGGWTFVCSVNDILKSFLHLKPGSGTFFSSASWKSISIYNCMNCSFCENPILPTCYGFLFVKTLSLSFYVMAWCNLLEGSPSPAGSLPSLPAHPQELGLFLGTQDPVLDHDSSTFQCFQFGRLLQYGWFMSSWVPGGSTEKEGCACRSSSVFGKMEWILSKALGRFETDMALPAAMFVRKR